MVQVADQAVNERGTALVRATFTAEDGTTPATPKTLYTQITDISGNVIEGKKQVTVGLASTMYFLLKGGQIPKPPDGNQHVVLTVEYTYDSARGSDLPGTDEYRIPVNDLVAISSSSSSQSSSSSSSS